MSQCQRAGPVSDQFSLPSPFSPARARAGPRGTLTSRMRLDESGTRLRTRLRTRLTVDPIRNRLRARKNAIARRLRLFVMESRNLHARTTCPLWKPSTTYHLLFASTIYPLLFALRLRTVQPPTGRHVLYPALLAATAPAPAPPAVTVLAPALLAATAAMTGTMAVTRVMTAVAMVAMIAAEMTLSVVTMSAEAAARRIRAVITRLPVAVPPALLETVVTSARIASAAPPTPSPATARSALLLRIVPAP